MKKIYDQTRLAMLESRLDLPVQRSRAGIELAGMQAAESSI
jgi:hypothetical protein